MSSLFVLAVVIVIVLVWVQKTRKARKVWLFKLDLPGTWDLETNDTTSFEFIGNIDGGNYIYTTSSSLESGSWQIVGNRLVLTPNELDQGMPFELRFFSLGLIGIHGPDRERHVYRKRVDNVVPLRPTA